MTSRLAFGLALSALTACASDPKCPPPYPGVTPAPAPPSDATPPAAPPSAGVFHIEVARDGTLSIEGAHVADPRELGERARASAKQRPDLLVVVAADPQTPFAYVLQAHDIARQSGFQHVTVAEGRAPAQPAAAPAQRSVPALVAGDAFRCSITQPVDRLEDKSAFIAIHVGPDGVAQTVDVLEDPGSGLGEAARICALNQTYRPALDANGKPTVGVKKLRLHFQRR